MKQFVACVNASSEAMVTFYSQEKTVKIKAQASVSLMFVSFFYSMKREKVKPSVIHFFCRLQERLGKKITRVSFPLN